MTRSMKTLAAVALAATAAATAFLVLYLTRDTTPSAKAAPCGEQRLFGHIKALSRQGRGLVLRFDPAWFTGGAGVNAEHAKGYFGVLAEYGHAGRFLVRLVSLPFLLLSSPLSYGGGMDVLGDLGWDVLLWLLPVGALALALFAGAAVAQKKEVENLAAIQAPATMVSW